MSKRQGKGVRQTVKGFLSGARNMSHSREDETFFAGSSSSGSRRSQLLSHVEAEGSSQQRWLVLEVLYNIFTEILLYGFYILRLV
jgi:hypothetical protein